MDIPYDGSYANVEKPVKPEPEVDDKFFQETEIMRRQQAWVTRRQEEAADGKANWRPVPMQRVATKHMLLYMDNVIRVMTVRKGLVFFKRKDGAYEWKHYSDWPVLGGVARPRLGPVVLDVLLPLYIT